MADKVDVLAVMDRIGTAPLSDTEREQMAAARDLVADLMQFAENAEKVIRNCVNAGQISAGYGLYADDLRNALASLAGAQ